VQARKWGEVSQDFANCHVDGNLVTAAAVARTSEVGCREFLKVLGSKLSRKSENMLNLVSMLTAYVRRNAPVSSSTGTVVRGLAAPIDMPVREC